MSLSRNEYLVPNGVTFERIEYNEPQHPIFELSGSANLGHILLGMYSLVSRKRSILQWVQLSACSLRQWNLTPWRPELSKCNRGIKNFCNPGKNREL